MCKLLKWQIIIVFYTKRGLSESLFKRSDDKCEIYIISYENYVSPHLITHELTSSYRFKCLENKLNYLKKKYKITALELCHLFVWVVTSINCFITSYLVLKMIEKRYKIFVIMSHALISFFSVWTFETKEDYTH